MKKIFSIVLLFACVNTFAQSTSPRYGTAPNTDNTYRLMTNGFVALTDTVGADSVAIAPKYFNNVYKITLLDSFCLKQPVVTKCFAGDQLTLIATAASGTPKLKFNGSNWIGTGTATLSTGLRSVITFIFDGAKWVEKSRVTQ